MANQQISPDEVITAIKSENRQAAAGKIGAPPVPAGQRFEYPVTAKGRLDDRARVRGHHRPRQARRLEGLHEGRGPRRARLREL